VLENASGEMWLCDERDHAQMIAAARALGDLRRYDAGASLRLCLAPRREAIFRAVFGVI